MSTFNTPPGVTTNDIPGNEADEPLNVREQIKQGVGAVCCKPCEAGDHEQLEGAGFCCCVCHAGAAVDLHFRPEPLSQVLDRERITDAREELNSLLPSILSDVEHAVKRLDRAHGYACDANDGVTALWLSEVVRKAGKLQRHLRLLMLAREGKTK